MKKISLAFLVLTSLFALQFQACSDKEDDLADFSLNFTATHEASPLVFFQSYPVTGQNDTLEYQLLNFFVSDVKLVRADGSTVQFSDVNFIDFSHNLSLAEAQAAKTLTFNNVATGTYTGMEVTFGLNATVNATEPGDYTTASPLGDGGNYWTAWDSYIFSRTEGRLSNGSASPISFLYHSGVDGALQTRSFTFAQALVLESNQVGQVKLNLQAEKIFYNSSNPIDIATNPVSHSGAVGTSAYELARRSLVNIADNMVLVP